MYVSKNRLAGSLVEAPLEQLLEACHRSLLTGTIRIQVDGKEGVLQIRAGAVDEASFEDLSGDPAVARLKALRNGTYELSQRLPDLSGALGSAAALDGEVSDVPLTAIMRHCEDNALSCTLVAVAGYDRAEIVYRAGDLMSVSLNGKRDDDALLDIAVWKDARFRVQLPPLDPGIDGWPAVRADPTAPFHVESAAPRAPHASVPLAASAPGAAAAPVVAVAVLPSAPAAASPVAASPSPPSPRSAAPPQPAPAPPPAKRSPTALVLLLLLAVVLALAFVEYRWHFGARLLGLEAPGAPAPPALPEAASRPPL
jgi:hypothetical protein